MITTALVLTAFVGIGLTLTILIQNPKGSSWSAQQPQQWIGAAQAQPVLERVTWGFAAALLILCLVVV